MQKEGDLEAQKVHSAEEIAHLCFKERAPIWLRTHNKQAMQYRTGKGFKENSFGWDLASFFLLSSLHKFFCEYIYIYSYMIYIWSKKETF